MDAIFVSSLITQLLSGPSFNANKICANITQCLKKMHLTDRFNGNGKNNIYGKYEFCRFLFHKLWTYFNETDNFKTKVDLFTKNTFHKCLELNFRIRLHYVKSASIRSCFVPYFPEFVRDNSKCGHFSRVVIHIFFTFELL